MEDCHTLNNNKTKTMSLKYEELRKDNTKLLTDIKKCVELINEYKERKNGS